MTQSDTCNLITQSTVSNPADTGELSTEFTTGCDAYDDLGTIVFQVKALAPYRDEVRVEPQAPAAIC